MYNMYQTEQTMVMVSTSFTCRHEEPLEPFYFNLLMSPYVCFMAYKW